MSVAWIGYVLAISGLAGLVARGAEVALRATGWQGRVPWALAMLLSSTVAFAPFLSLAVPPTPGLSAVGAGSAPGPLRGSSPPGEAAASVATPSGGSSDAGPLDVPLPGSLHVWAGLSTLVLLLGGAAAVRNLRATRRWPVVPVAGGEALRSKRVGPAVVGVLRGRVVLPEWTFRELTPQDLELVLRHEEEHVRGRDVLVLTAAGLLVAVVPWNPVLWWQLRRLAQAVELDCDLRTVRGGADPARYGRLLVEVARRSVCGAASPRLALGRTSGLRCRIDQLTSRPSGRRLASSCLAAVLALVAGCELPTPAVFDLRPLRSDTASADAAGTSMVTGRALYPEAFRHRVTALARHPAALESRGAVALAVAADARGRIRRVRVDALSEPSVTTATVDLAVRLARRTRVAPVAPDPGDGWIPLWVVFAGNVVEAHFVRGSLYVGQGLGDDREALQDHLAVAARLDPRRFAFSHGMAAADRLAGHLQEGRAPDAGGLR